MENRKKERMIKNSFPWQEYFNVELKVYFFFFFAFRVLIFTNMLIMRRMNIILLNIILKGQKPKLNYVKENYPDSSTQMQFRFG